MHLKGGHRLHNDKYQILNILGEGGFSLTYRGAWKTEVQGTLGKVPTLVPICIKEYFFKDYCIRNQETFFIETNSATGQEIFEKNKEKIIKEARILSEIHHPNVVNVLEVFKQNNTVYIVMEFIAGHSLKQEVEQHGIIPEEKLKKIIYKIGQALDYIHEKNILHLDIKPNNILMDRNNNPKLIDFGISKRYDLSDDQETSTTLQAASKGYASVEQYDSEGMQSFSPRPDIYSLGATMYFLLTGQVPTESILRSTKGLQNPRELNPSISENTENVILKAMALSASDRYATVMEMLEDLGYDPELDKIDLTVLAEGAEEKTELIRKIGEQPYDADKGDETVIHPNLGGKIESNRKKNNFWAYALFTVIIIGTLLLFTFNEKITDTSVEDDTRQDSNEIIFDNYFKSGVQHFKINNFSQAREEFTKALNVKESVEAQAYIAQIDSLSNILISPTDTNTNSNPEVINTPESVVSTIPNTKPKDEAPEVIIDSNRENYLRVFNKAMIAYDQQNYNEAKQLFLEAATYQQTTDVNNYIQLCEKELKQIEIQNKRNSYDILMNFGNFVVAKKKSDGLFGAIDKEGREMIPCIYLSTERSGNNRLFQRNDDLYDLYSSTGELLDEAISGF